MMVDPGVCPHCGQELPSARPLLYAHDGLMVRGMLSAIEVEEDCIIATIGRNRVVFDPDKEAQLRPYLGQRIESIMDRKKLIVMSREEWNRRRRERGVPV